MNWLIKGASVYRRGKLARLDMSISGGRIKELVPSISPAGMDQVFDFSGSIVIPGFVDVHVHLREPGFSYKETMNTGTRAAARGGYTHVCAMPNLDPPPDSVKHLMAERALIDEGAVVHVHPYAALTVGRKGAGIPVDFARLAPYAVGFSDDGTGVQAADTMRACMRGVRDVNGIVAAHCEDDSLLHGGYIHDGQYAARHGHAGISSESEWGQIARDIRLAEETGCRYHVCHISTKESVRLIRDAKARGVDISCEVGPHYLTLTDEDLIDDGRFKMNPPIRSREDRDALIGGLVDGTIDMIATDHAPHSAEEKSRGLAGSAMGIVGLETAFPVLYTALVQRGILTLEQLLGLMIAAPRARFGVGGEIEENAPADFAVISTAREYAVDPGQFHSMGRATPFEGWTVRGECLMTAIDGEVVYRGI